MVMVTFNSATYSLTPLPDAINDVLGHDLAAWLRAGLLERGHEATPVIGEDYGYGFHVRLHRAYYWIGVSMADGDADPPLWGVSVDLDPGCLWIWRLKARPQPGDKQAIARAIHALLIGEPGITRIEWWAQAVGQGAPTAEP